MKKLHLLILCLSLAFILTGCAGIKTYTYQEELSDQNLNRGNRGYVAGEAPAVEPGRKTTRTMIGVDVELPPSEKYETRKKALKKAPVAKRPVRAEVEEREIIIEEKEEKRGFADDQWVVKERIKEEDVKIEVPQDIEYTVKKGDTLQKIAKKFLGRSSRWPEIYKANKDIIKKPSKIYPGQVIIIPGEVIIEEQIVEVDYK